MLSLCRGPGRIWFTGGLRRVHDAVIGEACPKREPVAGSVDEEQASVGDGQPDRDRSRTEGMDASYLQSGLSAHAVRPANPSSGRTNHRRRPSATHGERDHYPERPKQWRFTALPRGAADCAGGRCTGVMAAASATDRQFSLRSPVAGPPPNAPTERRRRHPRGAGRCQGTGVTASPRPVPERQSLVAPDPTPMRCQLSGSARTSSASRLAPVNQAIAGTFGAEPRRL